MRDDGEPKVTFDAVDQRDVLEKLAGLSVEYWAYKKDPAVRHMGPMAQDFAAAFRVGSDDRYIEFVDANGAVMGAIQGLHRLVKDQEARIRALEEKLAETA